MRLRVCGVATGRNAISRLCRARRRTRVRKYSTFSSTTSRMRSATHTAKHAHCSRASSRRHVCTVVSVQSNVQCPSPCSNLYPSRNQKAERGPLPTNAQRHLLVRRAFVPRLRALCCVRLKIPFPIRNRITLTISVHPLFLYLVLDAISTEMPRIRNPLSGIERA
jgi:hypothetical protein